MTALPISVESRKPKGFQWLCTDLQAATPLFVPILPLPSCLKPREVFVSQGHTQLLHPSTRQIMEGREQRVNVPFFIRAVGSTKCPLVLQVCSFIPVHMETKSQISEHPELQVFISYLFLYNERNTWVDKKDQSQPREQRSLSSVISYWKVFPGNWSHKVWDHWRTKEVEGTMEAGFFQCWLNKSFWFSLLVIFSWKRLPQKTFWLALVAVMKNITALYKCSRHFVMFLFQLLN